MNKKILITTLMLILAIGIITACGKKTENKPSGENSASGGGNTPNYIEAYNKVLDKTDKSVFSKYDTNIIGFEYALVEMTGDETPELLLSGKSDTGVKFLKFYRYNHGKAYPLKSGNDEQLKIGISGMGGFRGTAAQKIDGSGLFLDHWKSSSGKGNRYDLRINGKYLSIRRIDQMSTVLEDKANYHIPWNDIQWCGIDKRDSLKSYKPLDISAGKAKLKESRKNHENQYRKQIREAKDEGYRILKGRVRIFDTDSELISFQKIPDMNTDGNFGPYVTLIFDQPEKITANNGDGSGEQTTRKSKMISIYMDDPNTFADMWDGFDKKKVTIKIEPHNTWWPSDVSLPVGEPRYSVMKEDLHMIIR